MSTQPIDKHRLLHALQNSLIFGELPPSLIEDLAQKMQIFAIAGGETLYQQGQPSDSLAIVISGRFKVQQTDNNGEVTHLGEVHSGRCVGELGLILNQARAANVIASRDSSVASLSKTDFERLLCAHPIEFNRAITRRVYEFSLHHNQRPPSIGATNFALVPLTAGLNIKALANKLAKQMAQNGLVHYFSAEEGQDFHSVDGACIHSSHRFNDLEQTHDYLLLETEYQLSAWFLLAIRQADHIILVADSTTTPQQLTLADDILTVIQTSDVKQSLVLLHDETAEHANVDRHWPQIFKLDGIYPIRLNKEAEIARLVRFLTGTAIGLVLGGGGARGLAHVGVIQALEEANIPIDIICGNSMGALIGAQYALSTPSSELISSTRKLISGGERPTLPIFSLLAGKKIKAGLQQMFGDLEINSLWQPFFAVSCNLSKAKIHTHDSGPVWHAILASNSPAGILPPVIQNGELFVDAALLDNVPVKPMRDKLGFGTLIAVDVDVQEELKIANEINTFSPWRTLAQYFNKKRNSQLPNIMEILQRSGHLGGLAKRETSIAMADYYLQPPVSQFRLMAYNKGRRIADAGYQYAKQHIADIKNTISKKS
ncbi:cyclic nucleotide-binding and patatin-like phospholipase domain-containing protein [Saccharobesus litoralis]|nr:cyclic nucleotide-binding and patatin-like phospholipase domain-containing protein [Saccharobesus litoralis]